MTWSRNRGPVIGPSSTWLAVIRSARRAAVKVSDLECPCGTAPTTGRPRGAYPHRRPIWVFAAVSSTNTTRFGSRPGATSWCQAERAAATSSRSRSAARVTFFERRPEPADGGP